jgi:hypothetical protein
MTYIYPDTLFIQFAKAPELNKVKTRMQSELSGPQCVALHKLLVTDIYKILNDMHLATVELWITGDDKEHFFQTLNPSPSTRGQHGEDLGTRMYHALKDGLQRYRYAILVGSDCPFITPQILKDVIEKLSKGVDCVLGPATDGGYVLIGLQRINLALFTNIEWGSERVLAQTRLALENISWQWFELDALADIDTPEDLKQIQSMNRYKEFFLTL